MTKKIICLLLILLCFALPLLPSCHKAETPVFSAQLVGSRLSWDAYPDAARYLVRCTFTDGSGYTMKTTNRAYTLPHKNAGDYLYTVEALDGDGKSIAQSESFLYHMGKGSSNDPIPIGDESALLSVKMNYTATFGDIKVSAPLYYRLTTDLDFSGREITPIGIKKAPFSGVLDGDGHTIRGLSFTKCTDDGTVGLFGAIENATIKNLTLENASISFDKSSGVSGDSLCFGLLAGSAVSSTIDNCHVTGRIEALKGVTTSSNYDMFVGGIVGYAKSGRMSGVSFRGDIEAHYGCVYAGGLLGEAESATPAFVLANAFADANVKAVGTAYDVTKTKSIAYARAGVLVGSIIKATSLSSLVAVGSAIGEPRALPDGTEIDETHFTAGAFGKTNNSSGTNNAPINNLFYLNSIPKASGTCTSLGASAPYVHALSEAEMKDPSSYLSDGAYTLETAHYWRIAEGEVPSLNRVPTLSDQPALEISLAVEGQKEPYLFSLTDSFYPTWHEIVLDRAKEYFMGYRLSAIFKDLNITYKKGMRIRFSAEGREDLTVTLGESVSTPYLVYCVHTVFDSPAEVFGGGYKIIDEVERIAYDYTNVKRITITVLPAESAEA